MCFLLVVDSGVSSGTSILVQGGSARAAKRQHSDSQVSKSPAAFAKVLVVLELQGVWALSWTYFVSDPPSYLTAHCHRHKWPSRFASAIAGACGFEPAAAFRGRSGPRRAIEPIRVSSEANILTAAANQARNYKLKFP